MLEVVDGGCGGVGAAAGESPADEAGLGLLDAPAGCLFAAMVPPALGAEVALVGRPVGPGHGMVHVAVDGLRVAAGGVARGGAGAQEVLELAAWGVLAFRVAVVALAAGDQLRGELELPEELVQPGQLGGVGGIAWA
jgi:hypothetical protein